MADRKLDTEWLRDGSFHIFLFRYFRIIEGLNLKPVHKAASTLLRRCMHAELKEKKKSVSDRFIHTFCSGRLCSRRVSIKFLPH